MRGKMVRCDVTGPTGSESCAGLGEARPKVCGGRRFRRRKGIMNWLVKSMVA